MFRTVRIRTDHNSNNIHELGLMKYDSLLLMIIVIMIANE